MRKPTILTATLLLVIGSANPGHAAAAKLAPQATISPRYSANLDFSPTMNPNGVWSYGFTTALGGPFAPYVVTGANGNGCTGWFGPVQGGNAPGWPLACIDPSPAPPQVLMHPIQGMWSVVRWTAPSKGKYDVVGRYWGGDTATTDVHVLVNDVPIFDAEVNGLGDQHDFALTRRVRAGDTVDFVVGVGSNGTPDFDSTELTVVISPHLYDFKSIDFPGAMNTRALGLNDRGDVVGRYDFDGVTDNGYLLQGGKFSTVDVPNAAATAAVGINNQRQVVGDWFDGVGVERGFLLNRGAFTSLEFPGAANTSGEGINDRGDIVGIFDMGDINTDVGFFLRDGRFASFEVPGSFPQSTVPFSINNRGQIAGFFSDLADPNPGHGFLLDHGRFTQIDVPGADETLAWGINDRGQISGECFCIDGLRHGFVLSSGTFTIIDFPVANSRTRTRRINSLGQIVGNYSVPPSTALRGFIATPAPPD